MTAPDPGTTKRRARGGAANLDDDDDTVTLRMSPDEADAFTVVLLEAVEAWEKHGEQTHSARLNAMHFRALRNKVRHVREQLPDSYPKLEV
jgi:hypothetical protein